MTSRWLELGLFVTGVALLLLSVRWTQHPSDAPPGDARTKLLIAMDTMFGGTSSSPDPMLPRGDVSLGSAPNHHVAAAAAAAGHAGGMALCPVELVPVPKPSDDPPTPTKILLIGEGRAGTSLALDLISSTVGKSVFSIFEPYNRFYKRSVERNSSTFPGGLDALFDCSFSRRPGGLPDAIRMWARVQHLGAAKPIHADCYFKASQLSQANSRRRSRAASDPPVSLQRLEAALFSACMAAGTRVAKIIRFKGPMLEIPDGPIRDEVKVVHIVRHPVPLVASRVKMRFEAKWPNGTRIDRGVHTANVCERTMARHRYLVETLPPDRILEFRYEDMVANVTAVWQRLHAFVGAPPLTPRDRAVLATIMGRKHQAQATRADGSYVRADVHAGPRALLPSVAAAACAPVLSRWYDNHSR